MTRRMENRAALLLGVGCCSLYCGRKSSLGCCGLGDGEDMTGRYRRIEARPGELKAAFGRDDVRGNSPDIMYAWGGHGASSPDGRVLSSAFEEAIVFDGKPLRKVLEDRGYDITTLRFTIQQKVA